MIVAVTVPAILVLVIIVIVLIWWFKCKEVPGRLKVKQDEPINETELL